MSDWRRETYLRELGCLKDALARSVEDLMPPLLRAADLLVESLRAGGTIFFCGNGGSAAQALHLATELSVKLDRERGPLRALALGANNPLLTAAANDLGYEEIWVRELEALARPGDVLVVLTTSGKSPNIVRAAAAARKYGVKVVGLLGRGGGDAAPLCEVTMIPPGESSQHIQEVHLFLGHLLCHLVETEFCGWVPSGGS